MTGDAPALLKDILGAQALATIADAGTAASPRFDRTAFVRAASEGLDALSIMERVRHIADALVSRRGEEVGGGEDRGVHTHFPTGTTGNEFAPVRADLSRSVFVAVIYANLPKFQLSMTGPVYVSSSNARRKS